MSDQIDLPFGLSIPTTLKEAGKRISKGVKNDAKKLRNIDKRLAKKNISFDDVSAIIDNSPLGKAGFLSRSGTNSYNKYRPKYKSAPSPTGGYFTEIPLSEIIINDPKVTQEFAQLVLDSGGRGLKLDDYVKPEMRGVLQTKKISPFDYGDYELIKNKIPVGTRGSALLSNNDVWLSKQLLADTASKKIDPNYLRQTFSHEISHNERPLNERSAYGGEYADDMGASLMSQGFGNIYGFNIGQVQDVYKDLKKSAYDMSSEEFFGKLGGHRADYPEKYTTVGSPDYISPYDEVTELMLKFHDDQVFEDMASGKLPFAEAARYYKKGENFDLGSLLYQTDQFGYPANIPLEAINQDEFRKIDKNIKTFQSTFGRR